MSLSDFKISSLDKLIAHEIYPKTEKSDAYATYANKVLTLAKDEQKILIERLESAINNSNKTFQLEFEDTSKTSIFEFLQNKKKATEDEFINYSQKLADELAAAHFRTKIPGGFCLIGSGITLKKKEFFFIIKAELQEVFNIQNNKLKLIKDVFLSPAKDFYKIGLFVKSTSTYVPYMYDDQFSLQKKDLTEYFYGQFLGLTTDKNDTLKSKNFFEETKHFIELNIDNMSDRLGLLKALNVLYREDTTGIISPKEFSAKYFEGQLKNKFDAIIEKKYPQSFTKDTSLIENRIDLQRISIPLTYSISLVGSSVSLGGLEVISDPSIETLTDLEPEINNGTIKKIVIVRQEKAST
jgi:hypothetical protein